MGATIEYLTIGKSGSEVLGFAVMAGLMLEPV
jgi:hypothetical protein